MAFQLLINGVDFTANFVANTLRITEALQTNGQSCSFTVQLSGSLTRPVGGNVVQFYRDSTLEFAGRVISSNQLQPTNTGAYQYAVECVDWTADFDTILIQEQWDPLQLAGDIIRNIVGIVNRGFSANNVVDGPIIDGIKADLEVPSSVVTRIAESIEHQWYIDYNRDMNFFYILDRPAPVTNIDFDTNITDYFDLELDEHVEQVKNVIYLTGATMKSQTTDYIKNYADGDTRFFPLNYEPWSISNVLVKVNGVVKTLLLDNVDGQAGDGQNPTDSVYVCLDNWGVRFPDASPPTLNDLVEITYNYAFEPVVLVEDAASIANMKAREDVAGAPSTGRHEFKFNVPELRVEDEGSIVDYGNLLLTRYKDPVFRVAFNSWTQGWAAGQNFTGVSSSRNFPSTQLFITTVTKSILSTRLGGSQSAFLYQIEASSSPFPQ